LYELQKLQRRCHESAVTSLVGWGIWRRFTANQRQIGTTLPDIPKKSTGRGGG
jgi:hypothetical protein